MPTKTRLDSQLERELADELTNVEETHFILTASCERRTPHTIDTSQVERDHKRGHEIRNSKRIHHHRNGSNKPN